ncbi:MAG: hypothetical protein PHN64_04020 [Desulfovibrionaceae bacterium]|nr:hypothetical protein [Desulfovibrionaceae bacterium]
MNETKLLPCPACGAEADMQHISIRGRGNAYLIACKNNECRCFRVGGVLLEQCVENWNALPRQLKWTTELPSKDGWYWIKHKNDKPTIGYICVDLLQYDIADYLFAGRIPEPAE